jgi:RNA polymerase sigma-70 factor (ECF subfamily)
VNACLDRVRRRQARPTIPLPEEAAAPYVDRDTAMDIRAALARLPVEQRAALVLVDIHGYGVAEAAEILGVAEGTVKSRCARGRTKLAVLLGYLRGAGHVGNQPSDGRVPSGSTEESTP